MYAIRSYYDYPSELGEYPQKKDKSKSENEYFGFLNNSYTLIKEFYPSQVGDIHPYGIPIVITSYSIHYTKLYDAGRLG